MSMLRKIQRVGKRATKFQYTATYQSVVIECLRDKWRPETVCVSWTRRGRRFISKVRPWQPSPDNKMRGVVIWPDPESMEITITLYKGPKDKSYETKEWEFAVIDVDSSGKRKVLASTSINMVRYASSMPFETDLTLRLKPVSRKIKSVILQVSLSSMFLREGKATDEDMMSIASMMSVSNLSTIGFLEDDEDDEYYWTGGRSISPPSLPDHVLSTDQLLNWARDITKDTPSVKISNMTTSWRNGMGFLAIIHYYRPDIVPDFDMLSPTSIKENNRLAFELARSLGVACPLTPNMMVTTTVPDKLAVTSFVYQLHQYFTRATQSAVARAEVVNGSGPASPTENRQSPFDISQIPEMFSSGQLSPVTTAPPSTDKVLNLYSRHSRNNSQADLGQAAQTNVSSDGRKVSVDEENLPEVNILGEQREGSVSPATRAKLQLDLLVHEHHPPTEPQSKDEVALTEEQPSFGEDRSVEYENTESSGQLLTETTSTFSTYDEEEGSSLPELPLDPKPISKGTPSSRESSTSGTGRKLPSPPADAESQEQVAKREERRKQAQEMLRRHKIKLNRSPDQVKTKGSSSDSKYRKQAQQMLTEAFNTPKGGRKSLDSDPLASDSSNTSVSIEGSPHLTQRHSTGNLDTKSPQHIDPPPVLTENTVLTIQTNNPESETLTKNPESESPKPSKYAKASSPESNRKVLPEQRRSSESNLLNSKETSSSNVEPAIHQRRDSEGNKRIPAHSRSSELSRNNKRPASASVVSMTNSTSSTPARSVGGANKEKRRQLPAIRPISAQPSQTLVRLAEQKKKEEEMAAQAAAEKAAAEALAEEERRNQTDNSELTNGDRDSELHGDEEFTGSQDDQVEGSTQNTHTPTARESRVTPVHKSLPSPAWSQHSEDLSQDLLITQSEYVKTELLGLREHLEGLENKAANIETRVRDSMANGNKEEEEDLMQEWFGLLNKKNELIKRQIELNMIEREEDLEKRQFFINRELRPLMEIPEDQKSDTQKDREAKLLGQLLELIDERDKLERRKMSTERSTNHERSSFASAQANASEIVNSGETNPTRQGSKDCVIS